MVSFLARKQRSLMEKQQNSQPADHTRWSFPFLCSRLPQNVHFPTYLVHRADIRRALYCCLVFFLS
jgi:hypothetical protein